VEFGREIGRKAKGILGPLIGAALIIYFAYHGVQGDRGLIAWWNLRYDIERADAQMAEVSRKRAEMEHRVSLLRPESLDRDMLEERSRRMLGAIHPEDVIIPLEGTDYDGAVSQF